MTSTFLFYLFPNMKACRIWDFCCWEGRNSSIFLSTKNSPEFIYVKLCVILCVCTSSLPSIYPAIRSSNDALIYVSVPLSVCFLIFNGIFILPSIHPSFCSSSCMSVYLSILQSINPSIHRSICSSSICISVCLYVYLSTFIYLK